RIGRVEKTLGDASEMTTDAQPPEVDSGLSRLLNPKSIAIIGASDRPGSFGQRTQANLERFTGDLWLVNPRKDKIGDQPCYASVADLPGSPDCVIIATPKESVEPLVDECIAAGAGGVLVYASGFAEIGDPDLTAMQARIGAKGKAAGTRVIGPNAIGFVNFSTGAGATFLDNLHLELGFDADPALRTIGLVSQSGALGLALTQGMMLGYAFSHVFACGNSCDVDVADCISYLAEDDSCRVITVSFEGHADPRRVAAACRKASDADKPVVIYKMAKGESGAAAAASHTGSLAGSHDAYRSLFEHAGAVLVEDYEALLEVSSFFARVTANNGHGMAVVATSGGAGIMAADAAEVHGVPLPQPHGDFKTALERIVPEFGSTANPTDVTAQVMNNMEMLVECVEGFLSREEYGALMLPHLFAFESSLWRIRVLDELAGKHNKLICSVWVSALQEGIGCRETIASPNHALFHSMDRCFWAFAAWRRWLERDKVTAPAGRLTATSAKAGTMLWAAAGKTLTEREAKPILSEYGIGVIEERTATTPAEARDAAEGMGYPVVLKLDAPDLAHKTEIGGVALNLTSGEAVEAAAQTMLDKLATLADAPAINGFLVQQMARKGVEIVIGGKTDPVFGPMVVVGLGGVLVEILRDTVTAPAPVTHAQASRMLERLQYSTILDGARDLPPVARAALAETVVRVSEFLADHADHVAELDINPVICRGSEITAVDALIIPAT
ncbi:MAG: acetate--CoA ligase family protein, partial [Pseudomonadota bacterium]